jgi:HTH-type transcriptional regulator/antitoxin HigA
MKTLISKELYEEYSKQCDELLKQICQYDDENEIPSEIAEKYKTLADATIEYEKAYHPLPGRVSTLITDAIKQQMQKRHLKQKNLAKLLGLSDSRISDLMKGKRALNLNVVKKLHRELNIPADFLLANC